MAGNIDEAVGGYYRKKSTYVDLLEATLKSQGTAKEAHSNDDMNRKDSLKNNSSEAANAIMPNKKLLELCTSELTSLKDGTTSNVNPQDIMDRVHEIRRNDERGADKASQERKKAWAEIDNSLGLASRKW